MLKSLALRGATVSAQLDTLRTDLQLLNDIKQTALKAKSFDTIIEVYALEQTMLMQKIDDMIQRRLDAMIALEVSDEEDKEDEEMLLEDESADSSSS